MDALYQAVAARTDEPVLFMARTLLRRAGADDEITQLREENARLREENASLIARKGSALLSAAAVGDADGIIEALAEGAQPDEGREHGLTPLMLSAQAGAVDAVVVLLDSRALPDLQSRRGCTAMSLAAVAGSAEVVATLAAAGASVDVRDVGGATALLRACGDGRESVVHALLQAGAAVDTTNAQGVSPLMRAADRGHRGVVETLLQRRASPHLVSTDPTLQCATALLGAAASGDVPTIDLLLEAGAIANQMRLDGATPLIQAGRHGRAGAIAALHAHARSDARPPRGAWLRSTLELSRRLSRRLSCRRLKGRADINLTDRDGFSALLRAAEHGHAPAVRALLAATSPPCFVDHASRSGATAAQLAERGGHADVAIILTAHAINAKLDRRKTPLREKATAIYFSTLLHRGRAAGELETASTGDESSVRVWSGQS